MFLAGKRMPPLLKVMPGQRARKICSHFCSDFVEIDAELYVNMLLGICRDSFTVLVYAGISVLMQCE